MREFLAQWLLDFASWTLISFVALVAAIFLLAFVRWDVPDPQWLRIVRTSIALGIAIGFFRAVRKSPGGGK